MVNNAIYLQTIRTLNFKLLALYRLFLHLIFSTQLKPKAWIFQSILVLDSRLVTKMQYISGHWTSNVWPYIGFFAFHFLHAKPKALIFHDQNNALRWQFIRYCYKLPCDEAKIHIKYQCTHMPKVYVLLTLETLYLYKYKYGLTWHTWTLISWETYKLVRNF